MTPLIVPDYTRQYAVLLVFKAGMSEKYVRRVLSSTEIGYLQSVERIDVQGFDERLMTPTLYFP